MGMDENKLILENQSRNTVENARNSKIIMQQYDFSRPILITSGFHMPRSMLIFKREGFEPVPYVTDYQLSGKLAWSIFNFVPNNGAFNNSCMAIREYMGILALKAGLQ